MENILSGKKQKEIHDLLRDKAARDETGLFVAEGSKAVFDIIRKGHIPEYAVMSEDHAGKDVKAARLLENFKNVGIPVFFVQRGFEKISSLKSPEGILIVMKKANRSPLQVNLKGGDLLVCLDTVQDPGNLGGIIRSSVAFGAASILLYGECADIYNPKVVRSSSGTILDIPIIGCDISEIDRMKERNFQIITSSARGENFVSIENLKIFDKNPAVLIFGSEGQGVSKELDSRKDSSFSIPIDEKVESLNVTAAVAVALYALSKRSKV